jgi:hypothetical protein
MRAPLARPALLLWFFVGAGCEPDKPEVNYPPVVVASTPGVGDIVTPGVGAREVAATLADDNLDDHLFIRFLVDYPAQGDLDPRHLVRDLEVPPNGAAVRSIVHIQPDCHFPNLAPGTHRFVMAVSDLAFLDVGSGAAVSPEAPFDSVPVGANRIRAVWLLNCP